jgi:hypothetical protein
MSRHDSKFVEPSFYVDPLALEFSGIECCITWGQFWSGDWSGQEQRNQNTEAQRELDRARALYEEETRRANAAIAEQQAALDIQLKEQATLKAQQDAALAETLKQADISKKVSAATLGQERIKSSMEVVQAQQQLKEAATQTTTTKQAGQTVGQPGISKTRVGTRIAIGGYGGTAPGKINPTGLNI